VLDAETGWIMVENVSERGKDGSCNGAGVGRMLSLVVWEGPQDSLSFLRSCGKGRAVGEGNLAWSELWLVALELGWDLS
jgi:hypothetical protein